MSMYENQELLTRTQVSEILACSLDTVDRLAAEGTLTKRYLVPAVNESAPSYMMGRLPRFRKSEVMALVDKRFGKAGK